MRHGVYTGALLRAFSEASSSQELAGLFQRVAASVSAITGGEQTPWSASSLTKDSRLSAPVSRDANAALLSAASEDTIVALHSRGILPKDSTEPYASTFLASRTGSHYPRSN